MFRLDQSADISGTSRIDSVVLPPAFLVARFGPPGRATDDGKVSGTYVFTDDHGNVFTVHDWKTTTLYYGDDGDWPTPAEFWADEEPYEFSVGGHGEDNEDGLNPRAGEFRDWLLALYLGCHFVRGD